MNDILKQRLVGALILLALGVVFWPIVFVEPEQESAMQPRAIPKPPGVSTEPIDGPGQADLRGSPALTGNEDIQGLEQADSNVEALANEDEVVAAIVSAPVPDDAAVSTGDSTANLARTEAPAQLTVDADGVPMAWTLRVATVSSAASAEALRNRLLSKHEKAYVTTVSSGGKQLYRVSVGPKFERQELERIQASINAEFGVKTMLVRYLP